MKNRLLLEQLIGHIDEPNRGICLHVLQQYQSLLRNAPGSGHNHQAWKGGYWDHLEEGMNIMLVTYSALQTIRTLPFSISDALLVFFLHDKEKPWRYILNEDGETWSIDPDLQSKESRKAFRSDFIEEHGFQLTEEHENALLYVESESDGYKPNERVMNPLAAFCHTADLISARIWHDMPEPSERSYQSFCTSQT